LLSYWHLALSRVKTHPALLSVCNDFLDSWTQEQLAQLPENCRPSRFAALDDIKYWVGVLSESLLAQREDNATMDALRYMLGFLFRASDRAFEIGCDGDHCAADDPLPDLPAAEPAA
jgi:hypothetical protein